MPSVQHLKMAQMTKNYSCLIMLSTNNVYSYSTDQRSLRALIGKRDERVESRKMGR